jgi:Cdc6-like AAA superfamily ATPase
MNTRKCGKVKWEREKRHKTEKRRRTTTTTMTTSSEDRSTKVATSLSSQGREELLKNLDETIGRFGDDPSGFQPLNAPQPEDSIIRSFAPKGLEESFKQLHSILFPCLCQQNENDATTTASAFVMGPRGSGKSLLLERCLAACRHQHPEAKFRKVLVHGIVSRGEDVPSVVYEIIRQLSEVAYQETTTTTTSHHQQQQHPESPNKKNKRSKQEKHMLRLRKSAFTSNLSLLESTLKIAEVDRIPVLLILDELDSFTDEGERQLLLYHLLDRVATPGSNLCLVGITSSFATLSLLEKRIRSRAEGTSKVCYVRPPGTYEELLEILKFKLDGCRCLREIIDLMTRTTTTTRTTTATAEAVAGTKNDRKEDMKRKLSSTLVREFRLGKDLRWFSRLLLSALSLYRYDVVVMAEDAPPAPKFRSQHLMEALEMMEASISDDLTASSTQHSNLCLVDGTAVDARLQALLDLSKPQVALVLSARRLLRREAHREELHIPLTLERIFQEYQSSFHRGAKQNENLLPAAILLLERGILVPSMDHSGGGPLQYHVLSLHKNLDPYSLSRMPLHMPMEIHRELGEAMNRNLLECSTALKEWGKKIT